MVCHFLVEAVKFPILDIHPWSWNHPKHTQHHLYPLLIFAIFPLNLSFRYALLSLFGNAYWILKTALQTSSPTVNTIPICFYDFPLFHWFFSFRIAILSIFGNVPCTLKTLPDIIFHYDFPLFIFHLALLHFSYLEMHTGSWKQHPKHHHQQWAPSPNIITNSEVYVTKSLLAVGDWSASQIVVDETVSSFRYVQIRSRGYLDVPEDDCDQSHFDQICFL